MKIFSKINQFLKNPSGVVSLEYGLGFALVIIVSIAAMNEMRRSARLSFYCTMPDQKKIHEDICKDMEGTVKSDVTIP